MRRAVSLALIVLVMIGATGCDPQDHSDGTAPREGVVPSAVTTAPAGDGAAATDGGTSSDALSDALQSGESSAVLQELSAIRKELDAIELPDDADFADIEAALD